MVWFDQKSPSKLRSAPHFKYSIAIENALGNSSYSSADKSLYNDYDNDDNDNELFLFRQNRTRNIINVIILITHIKQNIIALTFVPRRLH